MNETGNTHARVRHHQDPRRQGIDAFRLMEVVIEWQLAGPADRTPVQHPALLVCGQYGQVLSSAFWFPRPRMSLSRQPSAAPVPPFCKNSAVRRTAGNARGPCFANPAEEFVKLIHRNGLHQMITESSGGRAPEVLLHPESTERNGHHVR